MLRWKSLETGTQVANLMSQEKVFNVTTKKSIWFTVRISKSDSLVCNLLFTTLFFFFLTMEVSIQYS